MKTMNKTNDMNEIKKMKMDQFLKSQLSFSLVTFENSNIDSWLVKTPQQLQEAKAKQFKNDINKTLDSMGLYNPFTLKAVINGKGQIKILLYNINHYKKEQVVKMFEKINEVFLNEC